MDMDTVMGRTTTVRDSGVLATEVLIVTVEGAAEEAVEERVVSAAVRVVQGERSRYIYLYRLHVHT